MDDDGGADTINVTAAIATGSLFLREITQHQAAAMELFESDEVTSSEADFFTNDYIHADAMAKRRQVA